MSARPASAALLSTSIASFHQFHQFHQRVWLLKTLLSPGETLFSSCKKVHFQLAFKPPKLASHLLRAFRLLLGTDVDVDLLCTTGLE